MNQCRLGLFSATACIALGCVICARGAFLPNAEPVQLDQLSGCFGGAIAWCIVEHYDCPDPSGLPSTCTLDPATNICRMCEFKISVRPVCQQISQQGYTCTQTSTGNTCGNKLTGVPLNGSCANRCNANAAACGVGTYTVTGQPCP